MMMQMRYKVTITSHTRLELPITNPLHSAVPSEDVPSITSDSISRPDLPVSTRIPLRLYKKLIDKVPDAEGYHMYTDRCYTNIPLAEQLLKMKCNFTGTVKESTLRTLRGGNIISIDKPQMVLDYTANMGGVDPADEYAST
ncbi:hypothetical protein GQX74_005781 [Glossina fuscipes]|nr:hypothetical protein GQX74_005781 [Glossina fuscipes]